MGTILDIDDACNNIAHMLTISHEMVCREAALWSVPDTRVVTMLGAVSVSGWVVERCPQGEVLSIELSSR